MFDDRFIGERIAQLRTRKKVSARTMSLDLGQSRNYINTIENHYTFPSMSIFLYICDYFCITPMEFFDKENSDPEAISKITQKLKGLNGNQIRTLLNFAESFGA